MQPICKPPTANRFRMTAEHRFLIKEDAAFEDAEVRSCAFHTFRTTAVPPVAPEPATAGDHSTRKYRAQGNGSPHAVDRVPKIAWMAAVSGDGYIGYRHQMHRLVIG